MRYRICSLLLTLALASCNTRPELSGADRKHYENLIGGEKMLIKAGEFNKETREYATSLGVADQSLSPLPPFDKAAAERRIACLEDQRDQRVPIEEGVGFCQKTVPRP